MRRTHFLKVFQELKHTKELLLKKEEDSEERLKAMNDLDVFGIHNFDSVTDEIAAENLLN